MITATGLGSGLDISSLVTQLVSAERSGSDLQLSRESSKLNSKLSALGSLKGAMSGLQSSMASLNSLNSFTKRSATTSDAAAITVTAGSTAVPNTYALEVSQLAAAHSLASPAIADANTTAVGTGVMTFRFGTTTYDSGTDAYTGFALKPDSKVTTLTIDSSNNTLEGIMNAVNKADFGVSASIVNDGAGYRLLLSSNGTGANNSMEISVADTDTFDADTSGLSRLAFNAAATNFSQTAAAKDALFSVNGLAVSASTNTVNDTIPGVNLTLKKLTDAPVSIGVKSDTSTVTTALQGFLNGYNGFVRSVNSLTAYDAAKDTAGPLLGDFTVRATVSQVDNILRNAVSGLVGDYTSLSNLGITTNSTGEYVLDTAKFTAALKAAPDNVKGMFVAIGVPTDADISYNTITNATKVGEYAIDIASVATAGAYTGASVLPDFGVGSVVIDDDNRSLTFEIEGISTDELLLTPGTYTSGADLASEIQARINGASALVASGLTVKVSYDVTNNRLDIISDRVGDSSTVNITAVGLNTAATLGLSVADGVAGTNVAGSIGGVEAVGKGNILTAAEGSDADGLTIKISGTATGARGTINFTRGVTAQLNQLLGKLLDSEGSLEERIKATTDRQENVKDRKEALELKWEKIRQRYLAQFNALDLLMSQLTSTGNYLTSQLDSLPGVVSKY